MKSHTKFIGTVSLLWKYKTKHQFRRFGSATAFNILENTVRGKKETSLDEKEYQTIGSAQFDLRRL